MSCENRAKTVQAVRVMQAVPHAKTVQNRASCSCHAKKRASCSTCKNRAKRASCSCHAKTGAKPCKLFVSCKKKTRKLFHMQKPCKTVQAVRVMQKKRASCSTCKNHAKTIVRPAFDLVLRRIRSLKRCVQACGCKIETPRYACNLAPGCISSEPTFAGLRKTKKKKTRGPKKGVPEKKGKRGFLWQSLTSLEMQPGAKLQRISRGLYFAATRLHAAF